MMAPEEYYTFTGGVGEEIARHITHVLIDKALKFVPARAFLRHPNIVEVVCHDGVKKIEEFAFYHCPSLRRVIMPGVKVLETKAFDRCIALTYIECGKLEIIGEGSFGSCYSLSSIDLPSIKIVKRAAFSCCINLSNVEFGKDLETIGRMALFACKSLERITLPLKEDLISLDSTFQRCDRLHLVDLVGGVHETVAALLMEEWKHEMNEEIENVSQILPLAPGGNAQWDFGEKAQAIRKWIRSVLRKYTHYKAEHRRYVNEAAATLKLTLPHDILFENILPFVELPSDTSEESSKASQIDIDASTPTPTLFSSITASRPRSCSW